MIYSIYDFFTNIGLLYLTHNPLRVFLYSSFTLIETIVFALVLHHVIKKKSIKQTILVSTVGFVIFLIIYNLSVTVRGIDSIPIGIEAILILMFSFYYLFEQMNDTSNLFVYNRYSFWIVLGMMLYLAGSFFIYIYASQLPQKEVAKYWVFTNIFSILKNILFSVAIIVHASQSVKKNPLKEPMFTLS